MAPNGVPKTAASLGHYFIQSTTSTDRDDQAGEYERSGMYRKMRRTIAEEAAHDITYFEVIPPTIAQLVKPTISPRAIISLY